MKKSSFQLSSLALAVVGGVASIGIGNVANAAPQCPETLDPIADYKCIAIDTGIDFDGVNGTTTTPFYELGLTGTVATSIYEAGLANGSKVVDTNIVSVLANYGLAADTTTQNVANTGNVAFIIPGQEFFGANEFGSYGEINIDALNSPSNNNGFGAFNVNVATWGLYVQYLFEGTLNTATGPSFDSGYVEFYYITDVGAGINDPSYASRQQVMRVNITGSNIAAANLDVIGEIDFDFDQDNDTDEINNAFLQNFWSFTTGSDRFWDLFQDDVTIRFALDTNVNPPVPDQTQLAAFTGANQNTYWIRQTTLDSSVRFNAPEPGSLALLGIGLLGFGAVSRRKQVK